MNEKIIEAGARNQDRLSEIERRANKELRVLQEKIDEQIEIREVALGEIERLEDERAKIYSNTLEATILSIQKELAYAAKQVMQEVKQALGGLIK